jgi:hypothetical protein
MVMVIGPLKSKVEVKAETKKAAEKSAVKQESSAEAAE